MEFSKPELTLTPPSLLVAAAIAHGFEQTADRRLTYAHPRADSVLLVDYGEMTFEAKFVQPFAFQMFVRELREADYLDFWTTPELTFDDPDFDEAVLVRGSPFGVRQLLSASVRRCLLDLQQVSTGFSLDNTQLRAVCPVSASSASSASSAGGTIERFLEAVSALLGPGESRGAYR